MRSMTGYSKFDFQDENFDLKMEIKSVNGKNLNLKIRLPQILNFLEPIIRKTLAKTIDRGSVDFKIEFNDLRENAVQFSYDKNLSHAYLKVLQTMEQDLEENLENKLEIMLRNVNVIKEHDDIDENIYKEFILEKIDILLGMFIDMKQEEGLRLRDDLILRTQKIENIVADIKVYKDEVVENYKNSMIERLNKIMLDIDEKDILREILIFTDKCDISEEVSRLDSHLVALDKELLSNKNNGKKIDFILQEMFREFNTLGVKSNMYEISKLVVDGKTELEKIREQVMNIE